MVCEATVVLAQTQALIHFTFILDLVSLRGTGRDDISMQLASQDFRPCWIYPWVAVKLIPLYQFP